MSNKELKGTESVLGLSEVTENKALWRMVIAELLGTFLLVLIGCGSIVLPGDVSIIRIALTFGLTVATLAQCIGHISGCHVNPAVTLSLFVTGDIKLIRALLFVAAQVIGAIAGSALLKVMLPEGKDQLGLTNTSNGVTDVQGFLMEIILTFLLLFVIHAVCDGRRKDIKGSAPLAIGLTVSACHLCGIPYSGSSVNPARSFGPAVIMDSWENHWIYWAGPILGGVLAGLIYKFLFKVKKSDSDSYDF